MSARVEVACQIATPESFRPFGELVGLKGRRRPTADSRVTYPFAQWGDYKLDAAEQTSFALDVITRTAAHPMTLDRLYRHLNASQLQMDLSGGPLFIVVGPADVSMTNKDDVKSLRAFLIPSNAAVNIGRGVWHDGAYPVLGQVDLLNIQGSDHPTDTEILNLRDKFDVELGFRF